MDGLLRTTLELFFPKQFGGNIMSEVACEPNKMCDRNQSCFKAFLSTWLAFQTSLAPYTSDEIIPKLQGSAKGAAKQCSGGNNKKHCGRRWYEDQWDGYQGMEEQMTALGIFSAQMITHQGNHHKGPVNSETGGTSKSNPNAGSVDLHPNQLRAITTRDRAGASVVTVVFVGGWIATVVFMLWGG